MYYDPEGLWAWGDPIDPTIANAVTGFGDGSFRAITLGIGDLNELRQIVGIDGGVDTSCSAYQWSKMGGQVVGTVALSGALYTSWSRGWEISIGRSVRIAPWGNRTGHPVGRYPHYHRRGGFLDSKGNTPPGQGIGRHRPWEKRATDRSWRDRF